MSLKDQKQDIKHQKLLKKEIFGKKIGKEIGELRKRGNVKRVIRSSDLDKNGKRKKMIEAERL